MRVVALNIQHGGGRRTGAIVDAILAAAPDVVVLSEFHASPTGSRLLDQLAGAGLTEHVHGEQVSPDYPNTVAVASRLPLTNAHFPLAASSANRQRVLEVDVGGLTLGAVYFPLGKPKVAFWRDEFLLYAASRIERPCLLVGDWNSGRHHLDEAGATLDGAAEFEAMTDAGWIDAWRSLRPDGREYTWYSTYGNGFRLDHAFLSPSLAPRLVSSAYRHETRTPGVSDHSALVVELTTPSLDQPTDLETSRPAILGSAGSHQADNTREVTVAGMFVLGDDGKLVGLSEKGYDSEDLLQSLLASHPDLLAGEEMAPDSPRRWLLVSRETGVPDAAGAAARWSVDHLFLDQDGVPTLVEVKRSTDTRIRREVVGQMLDYAANALVYLPVEAIRSAFEARCASGGLAPESALAGAFGDTIDGEAFWGVVKTNLEAGRIRLVFVADLISDELRRIIEYLNGQMNPTEVYGVEIKQYVGEHLRTLVPRLIGRTADAGRAKSTGGSVRGETWTPERFDEELTRRCGAETVRRAHRILEWAARRNLRVWWGRGLQHGGFVPIFGAPDGVGHQLFEVWTGGQFEAFFQYLGAKGPFVDEAMRLELHQRLNAIPGISIPADAIARRPSFRLDALADEGAVDRVLAVFDWVLAEIEKAS